MARWNRAKESKDIFELIFSSWSLDDFCLYLAFWNMEDAWKRMKETNKKKSMRFLCNHFVFKLIQKWEFRKVHNQNLIFPLFQILGSRNREMFPHLYSANPSLPGMQPQPQDPVRAFFFSLVLKFFKHCYVSITSLSGGRWWWRSYNMDSFEEQKCSSISRQWKNHEHCKWTLQLVLISSGRVHIWFSSRIHWSWRMFRALHTSRFLLAFIFTSINSVFETHPPRWSCSTSKLSTRWSTRSTTRCQRLTWF